MIEQFLAGLPDLMEDRHADFFLTVAVPGDIDPLERHSRFSIPLDVELRLARLGSSSGGGTLYWDDDGEDEADEIAYCIIDIDTGDLDGARELLRLHLPDLGAPCGTLVQFGQREDYFDGTSWALDMPRTVPDPFD